MYFWKRGLFVESKLYTIGMENFQKVDLIAPPTTYKRMHTSLPRVRWSREIARFTWCLRCYDHIYLAFIEYTTGIIMAIKETIVDYHTRGSRNLTVIQFSNFYISL